MRKLRTMIGMPVVCRNRRIGRLIRPELDERLTRLKGIWVGAGLLGTRYIPAESIQLLGRVAILADDPGRRGRMDSAPLFHRAVSTDGCRLGAITGAEVDEISFNVSALELSRGLWDDLLFKRARIERYTANRETGEIVIDPGGNAREEATYEGRHDQGPDCRDADWRRGGDDLRRHELADGAQVEPKGEDDRQLDFGPG